MVPATNGPVASIPSGGVDAGLEFAPPGFSRPFGSTVVETIDQVNNVTLVFSAPIGAELADYYRRALPEMGFEITADANDTLKFKNDAWQGAVTTGDGVGAITMRTDWEQTVRGN